MGSEPVDEQPPAWHDLPPMVATSTPKRFATNLDERGVAWLWIRQPNSFCGYDFDPDAAETLGLGLVELAKRGREIQARRRADMGAGTAP